ncbi:MAG: BTAD domain-containing putative transcriptional regulator, partial [Anaerolineae bacterium]
MLKARLRLLGDARLTAGPAPHGEQVPLAGLALLAGYLALHPDQPISRDRLAFTLWPDVTEEDALLSLRQCLFRLRRALSTAGLPDDVIEASGRRLLFKSAAGLWVDVHAFQAAVEDPAQQVSAIELYRGHLLDGHGAPWIEPVRAHLLEQVLRALRTQTQTAIMRRNTARALNYARQLVEADPLRESSHRILKEALALNGQRVQALQHYETLCTLLHDELGIAPMHHTRDQVSRIQHGSITPDLPPVAVSPQASLDMLVSLGEQIVGRREQIAVLDDHLARAMAGQGSFVLLTGDWGTGKTTLLTAWTQAREPAVYLYTVCAADHPQALTAALDWSRLPEQAREPDPSAGRLGALLLTAAAHAGDALVLAIDSLQHATRATWQTLAYLAQRAERFPLLIVAAARDLNGDQQAMVHALQRAGAVTLLPLKPFTRGQIAQLAERLTGAPPQPVYLNRLIRESEGVPLVAEAFIRAAT